MRRGLTPTDLSSHVMNLAAPVTEADCGAVTEIAPGVRRVLAPNPGRMTGPGTNSYLVGYQQVVVIDPGPAMPSHMAALVAAVGSARLEAIAVTHTHRDHSPAALALHRLTGAPRRGLIPRHLEHHDATFVADLPAPDGTVLVTDAGSLRAVATPGHASNHLCWFHVETQLLFTGDHVLGTVSPVILPPDGDMTEYLDSLQRLRGLAACAIAPGHGPVLADPEFALASLLRHRQMRERKIISVLQSVPSGMDALVHAVYDDVDPALHNAARYTLLAHLIKLERDGRVQRCDDSWMLLP